MKHDAPTRVLLICAVLLFSTVVHAQKKCGAEVKLLLSPTAVSDTIASFQMGGESAGQVYFYDTDALDLLSKGVIVRLRQGSDADLTVKIRPLRNQRLADPSRGNENFKCESDMVGGVLIPSYSIRSKYSALSVPDGGAEIFTLLSDGQKKLIEEAGISIDWSRVKRIGNIKSTGWNTSSQSAFVKLTLELWEWPSGSALELSTKVSHNRAQPSYAELVNLVNTKFLPISAHQSSKTRLVLEDLTSHRPQ